MKKTITLSVKEKSRASSRQESGEEAAAAGVAVLTKPRSRLIKDDRGTESKPLELGSSATASTVSALTAETDKHASPIAKAFPVCCPARRQRQEPVSTRRSISLNKTRYQH